jgi:hypothetical protein
LYPFIIFATLAAGSDPYFGSIGVLLEYVERKTGKTGDWNV